MTCSCNNETTIMSNCRRVLGRTMSLFMTDRRMTCRWSVTTNGRPIACQHWCRQLRGTGALGHVTSWPPAWSLHMYTDLSFNPLQRILIIVPHRIIWSWYTGRWWVDCCILVHRGGDWAGPQPAHAPPRCTKCNSPPISGQCTSHRIAVKWSVVLRF